MVLAAGDMPGLSEATEVWAVLTWKQLCGQAVALCRSQATFQREARILSRLVKQYGAEEVEHMLIGAQSLGWTSLRSLGSAEGLGRRMAVQAYWRTQDRKAPDRLISLAAALKARGF
jgi:hypothetical protein